MSENLCEKSQVIFCMPNTGFFLTLSEPMSKNFMIFYCSIRPNKWGGSPRQKSGDKNTAQKVIFLTKNVPYGQKCKINHNLLFQIRGTQKWGVGGPTFLHFFLTHPFILFCYHHCIVGVGVNP